MQDAIFVYSYNVRSPNMVKIKSWLRPVSLVRCPHLTVSSRLFHDGTDFFSLVAIRFVIDRGVKNCPGRSLSRWKITSFGVSDSIAFTFFFYMARNAKLNRRWDRERILIRGGIFLRIGSDLELRVSMREGAWLIKNELWLVLESVG